jgi:osmotically-inducible protein OsmY
MAEHQHTAEVRSDTAILEGIYEFIRAYDPLKASREGLRVEVRHGMVILTGYVQTRRERRVLLDNLCLMPGVMGVDDQRLYDDETMLLAVGQHLPRGVRARVENGIVVLVGHPVEAVNVTELILDISALPGVDEVRNMLRK